MAEKEEGCSQCKENLNNVQLGMIIFSVYLLITAIYGNIKLFELISNWF